MCSGILRDTFFANMAVRVAAGAPPMLATETSPQIPEEIEEYRDERWRREATRHVETWGSAASRPDHPR